MNGVDLVPILNFGENGLYTQIFNKRIREFQVALQKVMRISLPICYGAYGILPKKIPISQVFGSPVAVPKKFRQHRDLLLQGKGPIAEFKKCIKEVHTEYVHSVRALHKKYARKYGCPEDQVLEIFSPREARVKIDEINNQITKQPLLANL